MKRIRVAGLIEVNDGYVLMHRKNVKQTPNSTKPYGEYYVFPGGGLEENETDKEGVEREILEELGIVVKVGERIFSKVRNDGPDELYEYIYRCEYVSGTVGTGTGPEFSNNPKYKDRGEYIPEIVPKTEIKNVRLLPEEFAKQLFL